MIYLMITQEESDKLTYIFRKYEKPLFYFIYEIIKDWHMAEDILQLTFVKIVLNIKSVESADSAKTRSFIYTIARNTAINFYHKKRRDENLTVQYDDNIVIGNISIEEKESATRATMGDLERAAAALSDSDRKIIALKYKMGFTDAQIAEMLGIRNDAARKRLSRAKKRIGAIIASEKQGSET